MPILRKFLFFILLIWGWELMSQQSVGEEFHTDKGLPSNTVRTICLDEAGTVYVGTASGIQISPGHLEKNNYITKIIGRSQVWSIVHYKDWLYVGTFDSGLYIFNKGSGSLYRRYSHKEIPGIRRIRILQNKILGIYDFGAFEIRSLNLYKIFESPVIANKPMIPADIFSWKGKICIAHQNSSNSIFVWEASKSWITADTKFLPAEVISSKQSNLVYLEAHNQLFIGQDNNGYVVVNKDNSSERYKFKVTSPKQLLRVNDIAPYKEGVYLGIGNELNIHTGFIWKHDVSIERLNNTKKEISLSEADFTHYPLCILNDRKNDGIWYGSIIDGAYFLKDFKHWLLSPTDYIGLNKTPNFLFTWSKNQLNIYSQSNRSWKSISSIGCVKKIIELNNQIFVQSDQGIFIYNALQNSFENIYTGNSEHIFQLNGYIYWSSYFGNVTGYHPRNKKIIYHSFNDIKSIVNINSNGDFAIALASNQRIYYLKDNKQTELKGISSNNLNNLKIHFYGNLLMVQESDRLTFYSFDASKFRIKREHTVKLNEFSLEPINWISTNEQGLWIGINNTLIQLGVNQHFPNLSLISEYYLGNNKQNRVSELKSVMQLSEGYCYRKSGNFIEAHPLMIDNALGHVSDWQTEYQGFKVFKEDILPSIREGQNFRLKFNSKDFIFQNDGYILSILYTNDSVQFYRLNNTSRDLWFNDLEQGEYQLNLISTGKKMALPLIVTRRLLLNNLFWLLLILIVFMGIYIIYLSQQEKYSLQQRLIGLELATLKSNLNPHFIFNMMNLIQSMIVRSEQKRALKAISELAKINRLFLETSNKELISLVEEIDFAKKYVSLEQMRFEEDKQFTFKLNIEPNIELNHWLLPPLVVQPLLENSLKHGVLLTKMNPTMGITISLTNPYTLNILIYNSLPESNQRRSDGTNMGIHLVTERIKWVNEKYNEIQSIKMDVLPRMNNEFQVLITITKKDSTWLENL